MKVLLKLFQKLVGAGDIAGRCPQTAKHSQRRFLLPSFSLRLQHQRKAGNEFKCVLFSVKNIEFAPRLLTKYYKCKSFVRFSLMLQAQRKAWQKKAPIKEFRHCGGGKRTRA
ncbi:MAG: hypothetical protein IKJ91_04865 [Clostridia bacterium]|nr:hypothetical protein [Clostridia bacterium]